MRSVSSVVLVQAPFVQELLFLWQPKGSLDNRCNSAIQNYSPHISNLDIYCKFLLANKSLGLLSGILFSVYRTSEVPSSLHGSPLSERVRFHVYTK